MTANQVIESCESTNNLARELGEAGCPHGTWISARVQEKGRGRLGREWHSLEGNLFLSIVVRPEAKERWTWIPLATALAIAEALQKQFPELAIRVKWPNDLWVDQRKLGGILCEAIGGRSSFVVIGIGLNCVAAPKNLDQPATSITEQLEHRLGFKVTADSIRSEMIASVLSWMDLDPKRISTTYTNFAALRPGTEIQWGDRGQSGTVVGLGETGELRVKVLNGELTSLYAEDVKIRLA